jgi:hypothetical protein
MMNPENMIKENIRNISMQQNDIKKKINYENI